MKLICDDCGSVNSPNLDACELCGGSLSEERARADRGSVLKLLAAALVATIVLCVAPGVLIHKLWLHELSDQMFWLAYLGAWIVGSVLVRFYSPKEDYDVGWGHRGYIVDNPFTLRDDYDRTHLGIGLLLFPIGIVSGLWVSVVQQLMSSAR